MKDEAGMIITYNCGLDALARQSRLDDAEKLFAEIEKTYGADLISYSTMIKALCVADRKEKAMEILKRMIESYPEMNISCVN